MGFQLRPYSPPDFAQPRLTAAPEACFLPAPKDGVAPEGYHAMSIFPEYFKIQGRWRLAEESRMDCVAVWEGERLHTREFRRLRQATRIHRFYHIIDRMSIIKTGFCPLDPY